MDVKKAASILSAMETDAVVDVLKMTPKEKRALLTELLDDDARKDIAVIAAFDEDEIGSWMTTNCIVIRENLTVKQAMSSLVEQAAKNDNISTIFMVTEDQTFLWSNGPERSYYCKTGFRSGRPDRHFLSLCIWS